MGALLQIRALLTDLFYAATLFLSIDIERVAHCTYEAFSTKQNMNMNHHCDTVDTHIFELSPSSLKPICSFSL